MKPIRFLRPAEQELFDTARFYENQASGLGADFLDIVESAGQDIRRAPDVWPVVTGHVRRRLLPRFPYALLYRVDPDEIVVLAVMHLRRHPNYWTDRI